MGKNKISDAVSKICDKYNTVLSFNTINKNNQ